MNDEDRKIVKKADGYHVYSEDGSKHLGGPYKSEGEAKKRLEQVDYFKNKGKKSLILAPERRILPFQEAEIRAEERKDGAKHIVGYAAKFDRMSQNLGGFVEKIDKNAYKRVLSRNPDVMGLKNHSEHHILGRTGSGTMELMADETGLRYDIAMPETVVGRDTWTEVKRGDIPGSSFSFTVDDGDGDEWDDQTDPPMRTLLNVRDLFDVGPVTFPAYLDTEVNCRSFDRFVETRSQSREQEAAQQAARLAMQRQRLRLRQVSIFLPLRQKG